MWANLHSHTQFCDGRSTMSELLSKANDLNFSTWGFTPHAPIAIPSPCNMKEDDVPAYLAEVERLRKDFPKIKVLAGMEVDYLDNRHGPNSSCVSGYGLDYVIGSVHFIPNQHGEFIDIDGSPERFRRYLHERFKDDLMYVVRTYWNQVREMISRGGMSIIGHIDKIALNASFVDSSIEKNDIYRELAEAALNEALNAGLTVEINTKHYIRYGRFFPNPRFWPDLMLRQCEIPINSDTHSVEGIMAGVREAHTLLKKMAEG